MLLFLAWTRGRRCCSWRSRWEAAWLLELLAARAWLMLGGTDCEAKLLELEACRTCLAAW